MDTAMLNLKDLKYVLDNVLKTEKKHLSDEAIEYDGESYPKNLLKKFCKVVDSLMSYDHSNEFEDVVSYSECEDFETYWKFVEYKNCIFAVRMMFGQGCAEDIWVIDICKRIEDCDWIGDRQALKAWKECTGKLGKRAELQKAKLGPQECNGDPNDVESYSQRVLEGPIAIYGMTSYSGLVALAEDKMSKENSYKKFWDFMDKVVHKYDWMAEFCKEVL